MKIFANKKVGFALILATVVLVILLCWLLTLLTQQTTFNAKVAQLQTLIDNSEFDIDEYKKQGEYRKTWEYIIEQAIDRGMLTEKQKLWIVNNLD